MEPYDVLSTDDGMAEIIEKHGKIEIPVADDAFERFVTAVVNQQLSSHSAQAIRERLFQNFTVTPRGMIDADEEKLREIGLSRQKVEYIGNISERFIEKEYGDGYFEGMTNREVTDELTSIHGVGTWTSKMYLIFVLGREDVFPVEDLGIRNAMTDIYGLENRTEMSEKAEEWSPYRSYASLYLWRRVD
ncbi:MAG: DNA-3-methyladenine glycosylase [Halobacteria archaeon]